MRAIRSTRSALRMRVHADAEIDRNRYLLTLFVDDCKYLFTYTHRWIHSFIDRTSIRWYQGRITLLGCGRNRKCGDLRKGNPCSHGSSAKNVRNVHFSITDAVAALNKILGIHIFHIFLPEIARKRRMHLRID